MIEPMDWNDMFDVSKALQKTKAEQAAKRAKYATSEAKLQKDILAYLAKNGFLTIRINSSVQWTEHGARLTSYRIVNSNATAGVSDAIVMRDQRAYLVEIKTPKGRLSKSQVEFQELCSRYGMHYVVMRSINDAVSFVDIFNNK